MFYIGISGWTYKGWRGVFYPEKLPQMRELEHASREFNSIEINGTHYSLQKPDTFKSWAEQTPKHFIFSIKGSRYITHLKRLKDIETPLANFFASGVLALGEKLGPFLWQLPPSLKFDGERIGRFLKLLPHNTRAAARLAKNTTIGWRIGLGRNRVAIALCGIVWRCVIQVLWFRNSSTS